MNTPIVGQPFLPWIQDSLGWDDDPAHPKTIYNLDLDTQTRWALRTTKTRHFKHGFVTIDQLIDYLNLHPKLGPKDALTLLKKIGSARAEKIIIALEKVGFTELR